MYLSRRPLTQICLPARAQKFDSRRAIKIAIYQFVRCILKWPNEARTVRGYVCKPAEFTQAERASNEVAVRDSVLSSVPVCVYIGIISAIHDDVARVFEETRDERRTTDIHLSVRGKEKKETRVDNIPFFRARKKGCRERNEICTETERDHRNPILHLIYFLYLVVSK